MSEVPGDLRGTWAVKQAALETLREWLPFYLASVERQNGLPHGGIPRPPGAECYYSGLDFESEVPGEIPVVIVTAIPSGQPERSANLYMQAYELKVGCIVIGDTEEQATLYASMYGDASMLLAHIGGLQGLAEDTVMSDAPAVEWVSSELSARRMQRSVTTFTTWVQVLDRTGAPAGATLASSPEIPEPEAPASERPTVETVDIKVTVE